jgi:hypothetical protein
MNSSLTKLRESGEYDRIIERHLARFWDAQSPAPNPAIGAMPAQPVTPQGQPQALASPPSPKGNVEAKKNTP